MDYTNLSRPILVGGKGKSKTGVIALLLIVRARHAHSFSRPWKRTMNFPQHSFQFWKVIFYSGPYNGIINFHVFMHYEITHICGFAPRDFWIFSLCLVRNHIRRLSNNRNVSLSGSGFVFTCQKLFKRQPRYRSHRFASRFHHMLYSGNIFVHTATISLLACREKVELSSTHRLETMSTSRAKHSARE